MKKIFTFISIVTILMSCKKSPAPAQIIAIAGSVFTVGSYTETSASLYNIQTAQLLTPAVADSITVIMSVPLNAGNIIDTIVIPPYYNTRSQTLGSSTLLTGSNSCIILSVTSKGNYQFSY